MRNWVLIVALLLILGTGGAYAAMAFYPRDRTLGMEPEAVVEAAGRALLAADGYRFTATLTGISSDNLFPDATLQGEYQRSPQAMHLIGAVRSGEDVISLEYYAQEKDLYVHHPITRRWVFLPDGDLDEVAAYYPDALATPLLVGLRSARVIGREPFAGSEALIFALNLAPEVMLPQWSTLQEDRASYKLWVDTRTLNPIRIVMEVTRPPTADDAGNSVTSFVYDVELAFGGLQPVAVPAEVKAKAVNVGEPSPSERMQFSPHGFLEDAE